jgi:uncharacterized protein
MTARVRDRVAAGLLALVLGWGLGWPARLAALDIPFLAGHVNDQAGLLDLEQGRVIEEKLTAFEDRTGHQVVVLTVPSLEGEVLEDFAIKVAEAWKLGREEHDDGVLLLIAKDDRKLRIEVGYGLEAQLTDLLSQRILDEKVVPRFKEGDFAAGVDDGVTAILAVIDGGAEALPAQDEFLWSGKKSTKEILAAVGISLFVLLILGVFSTMALVTPGCGGWFLYFFMIPFNSLFPFAVFGSRVGGAIALGWIFGAPILRLLLPRTKAGKRWRESVGPIQWRSGGSGGGGYSGGGGGGYSGGGGSFGGGGASSSW